MPWIILTISLMLFTSCRSVSFDDLRPDAYPALWLPPLYTVIDTSSLKTFYWNDPSTHPLPHWPEDSMAYTSAHVYDIRVHDAIRLFERDGKENFTHAQGSKYGYITYKIAEGECRYSTVSALISLATLFVPNLFGLPFNYHMTQLELEVEIYDSHENMLARYKADGYSKAPIALWRGYRTPDACRLSNLKAIKEAMRHIKYQLSTDYAKIHRQLLSAGPIAGH